MASVRMDFQNEQRVDPVQEPVHTLSSIAEQLHNLVMENPPSRRVPRSNDDETNDSVERLHSHLGLIERRFVMLQKLGEEVQDQLTEQIIPLARILNRLEAGADFCGKDTKSDVEVITGKISDLASMIPPVPIKSRRHEALYSNYDDGDNNGKGIENLPGFQENEEDLTKLEAYRQVEQKFMELAIIQRICLLSFAVFPENKGVHRTMLMYWWIGEGILPVKGAEKAIREVLEELTEKQLVEPVDERRKVVPSSYKMNPFVHSSVIHLSKKIGLFDIYHKGEKPSMRKSNMGKVCLVEGSSKQRDEGRKDLPSPLDIETVFNVSERYPEFTFKWFSGNSSDRNLIKLSKTSFKSLHVFYLGRWERTQKRLIQVQNPELMKCLKVMKNLRLLSFQGISTITRLKSSVCKLHKLIVLDLRDCFELTKLPEKIDSLQSLVYLDMTGCYMLEWIPMRLALLKNLEVLKGFVVSDTIYEGVACNLSYLKRLNKLRKLSIEINRDDLGVNQLMEDLVKLKALTSLKVTWRRALNTVRAGNPDDSTKIKSLPEKLKKLDLQRFPREQLPTWLHPHNLLHLKKLYIGGARTLTGVGDLPEEPTKCVVEVLRVTFLPKLRVGWIELKQIYFPKLIFLEKYECPRVTLTPCDESGIWRSDQDD